MSDSAAPGSSAIGPQTRFRSSRPPQQKVSDDVPRKEKSRKRDFKLGDVNAAQNVPRHQPTTSEHHKHLGRFASLRHRFSPRHSSGGFLIDSHENTKTRLSQETTATSPSLKGKEREKGSRPASGALIQEDGSPSSKHQIDFKSRPRSSAAGSFLSHDVGSGGSSTTGRRSVNFDERLPSPTRHKSVSSERHGKPLMRDSVYGSVPRATHTIPARQSTSPAIDPAQIVKMALNLSEGRRMHIDPGHVPSIPSSIDRRTVSASIPLRANQHTGAPEHRSSPHSRNSKRSSSHASMPDETPNKATTTSSQPSVPNSPELLADEQPQYTFSPATLSRAERAKQYIELGYEHRRLLERLPPLKHTNVYEPNQNASLGRAYNPLQFLRNREARRSQRIDLSATNGGWDNVNAVHGWIDTVEQEAGQDSYVEGDIAHLPQWVSGTGQSTNPNSHAYQNSQNNEKARQSRLPLPQSLWTAIPSDMLADAYWLEQSDNKTMARTRHGHKLFKDFRRPVRRRTGTVTSTQSRVTRNTLSSEELLASDKSPDTAKFTGSPVEVDKNGRREVEDVRFSPQHKSRTTRVTRHFFRKPKDQTRNQDHASEEESDKSSIEGFPSKRGPKNTNIGPLERHMKLMIEKEEQGNQSDPEMPQPHDSPKDPEARRRGGVSEQSPTQSRNDIGYKFTGVQNYQQAPPSSPKHEPSSEAPRISVEDHDACEERGMDKSNANGHAKPPSRNGPHHGEPVEIERIVSRASRLGFLHRRARSQSKLSEINARNGSDQATKKRRMSHSSTMESDSEDQPTSPELTSMNYASSESLTKEKSHASTSPKKVQSTTRHFFKAGRIGDVLRHELNEPGKFDSRRKSHRPEHPTHLSRETFNSDTDENQRGAKGRRRSKSSELIVPEMAGHRRRSQSTDVGGRARHEQYHMKNLPSFVSSGVSPQRDRKHLSPYGDHISRQSSERRLQHKHSRHGDLAPPSIDTSDVSPTNSSPDLTRADTRNTNLTNAPSFAPTTSYGFASGDESVSGSEYPASSASRRLHDLLTVPGTFGRKGDLPITALTTLDARIDPIRHPQVPDAKNASKDLKPVALRRKQPPYISKQSLAYVRSMLLAPAVKAQSIVQLAHSPRSQVPPFFTDAFRTAGRDPLSAGALTRQQEFAVAAQTLSAHLQHTMSALDTAAVRFRADTCGALNARVDDLRDLVGNHLTHTVHDEGDRADAFVAQLTTTHTLSIKQVNDSVDLMMRKRRQRLRYLRRAGFAVLEWVLVGIMWWIWGVVSCIGVVKRGLGAVVWVVRWLLWLD